MVQKTIGKTIIYFTYIVLFFLKLTILVLRFKILKQAYVKYSKNKVTFLKCFLNLCT